MQFETAVAAIGNSFDEVDGKLKIVIFSKADAINATFGDDDPGSFEDGSEYTAEIVEFSSEEVAIVESVEIVAAVGEDIVSRFGVGSNAVSISISFAWFGSSKLAILFGFLVGMEFGFNSALPF